MLHADGMLTTQWMFYILYMADNGRGWHFGCDDAPVSWMMYIAVNRAHAVVTNAQNYFELFFQLLPGYAAATE